MINQSSLTDEQIKQMLSERGLSTKTQAQPQATNGQELSDEQIKQMMAQRGLTTAQTPALLQQFGAQALKLPGQIGGEIAQDPMQAILNLGGATGRALFSPVAGLESLAGRGLGALGIPGAETLQRMGAAGLGAAPGFKPELTPTLSQIPEAALLAGAVPGGIAAARAIPGLARGAAELIPGVKTLLGKTAVHSTENMMKDLSGGESLANVHTPVVNELKSDFSTNRNLSSTNFDNLSEEASKNGYVQNPLARDPMTGAPKTPGAKEIKFDNTINFINTLKKSPTKKFRDLGADLDEYAQALFNNPSFKNAHDIQMTLGREGSALKSSKEGVDRALGKIYFKARRNIINDINKTFIKNKDQSLADLYSNASDFHLKNVIPYTSNPTLRKIVTREGMEEVNPDNIHNILKKGEEGVRVARENLSPQAKKQLVMNALKPAFKGGEITPKDLIKRYRDFDKLGFGHLRTNELDTVINKIAKQKKKTKFARLAVGGLGAYEIGKQFGITPHILGEIL